MNRVDSVRRAVGERLGCAILSNALPTVRGGKRRFSDLSLGLQRAADG